MQTLNLSSTGINGQLLESNTPARLRAFRFLSERYSQRERTGVITEFILFALITLTASWSLLSLGHAFKLIK